MLEGKASSKALKSASTKRSSSKESSAKVKATKPGGARAAAKPDKVGATARRTPERAAAKQTPARGSASKTLQFVPKTVATKQDSFVSELNRASSTPATKGGVKMELRIYAV